MSTAIRLLPAFFDALIKSIIGLLVSAIVASVKRIPSFFKKKKRRKR